MRFAVKKISIIMCVGADLKDDDSAISELGSLFAFLFFLIMFQNFLPSFMLYKKFSL